MEDDEVPPVARAVAEVRGEQHDREGEEVRRSGEGLGGERREGHFVDDGGEERGQGREGDVAREEHEGGEVAFWVCEGQRDFVEVESRFSFCTVGFLSRLCAVEAEFGDSFFSAGEKARGVGAVGDLVPREDGGDNAGGAFDEKEQAPGGNGDAGAGFGDEPSETACKARGQGRGGDKEAGPKRQLFSFEEERKQKWDAG